MITEQTLFDMFAGQQTYNLSFARALGSVTASLFFRAMLHSDDQPLTLEEIQEQTGLNDEEASYAISILNELNMLTMKTSQGDRPLFLIDTDGMAERFAKIYPDLAEMCEEEIADAD